MRIRVLAAASAALLFTVAGPANAADAPVTWNVHGGWTPVSGDAADYIDDGYTLGFGVQWRPDTRGPLALEADLSWSEFDATQQLLDLGQSANPDIRVDDGSATVWQLTAAAKYYFPISARASFYGLAGIGVYNRDVELTQTVLVAGTWCDWWGFCYPAVGTGQAVVSSDDTTEFGWNVGIGFEFPFGYGPAWFIEARYQVIETDNPTEYIPIQIGYRF